MRTQGMGWLPSMYPWIFWTSSGLVLPWTTWWQPQQVATDGMPASTERSAEKWQNWQFMFACPGSLPAWRSCGNAMGWTEAASAASPASPAPTCKKAKPPRVYMPTRRMISLCVYIEGKVLNKAVRRLAAQARGEGEPLVPIAFDDRNIPRNTGSTYRIEP